MIVDRSAAFFNEAKKVLPGGVNSPVRAFTAVGTEPRFIQSADGCHMTDVDGNNYVDYVASWGPMILGHNHPAIREAVAAAAENGLSFGAPCPAEVDLARLMCRMVPGLEMVRMVSSGTEAVMSALRLARAATGRDKIIKFEGCYHGHVDALLVKAGSGVMTAGRPGSDGVTEVAVGDTLMAVYNDLGSVEALLASNRGAVSAVIVEPVAANMGVVPPEQGFLEGLRTLCDRHRCLLIFDEVITGFRLAAGGAQEFYGVRADLVTYGKVIGGGMPVGAYGGSRSLMEKVAPCGGVYQAGTLSGNPVAMAAGYAQLGVLDGDSGIYRRINHLGEQLAAGLQTAGENGPALCVNQVGSLVCAFFTDRLVQNYADAGTSDTGSYASYFREMLSGGYYLAPSQFEAMFIGDSHSEQIIQDTVAYANQTLRDL